MRLKLLLYSDIGMQRFILSGSEQHMIQGQKKFENLMKIFLNKFVSSCIKDEYLKKKHFGKKCSVSLPSCCLALGVYRNLNTKQLFQPSIRLRHP